MSFVVNDVIAEFSAYTPLDHSLFWAPPFAYLVFVPVAKSVLADKKIAEAVLRFRGAHNIILGVFSLVWTLISIRCLLSRGFTLHDMLCVPKEPLHWYVWGWYLSKFYEWVDSILLIAAGKELSSLHYNHHMSTASVVASHFIGRANRTSIFDWAVVWNAFVHTLMYFYYYSPKAMAPIKRVITRLQIVQHVSVVLAIVYTMYTKYASSCDVPTWALMFVFAMYGMYLVQFVTFYLATYFFSNGKGKADNNGKNGKKE